MSYDVSDDDRYDAMIADLRSETQPRVYIAGPITPKNGRTLEQNVQAGVDAYLALVKAGIPAYCPHVDGLIQNCLEVPHDKWMIQCVPQLLSARVMLLVGPWQESTGTRMELALAEQYDIPVVESLDQLWQFLAREYGLKGA